jgi:Amt family ammonium transporter
MSALSAALIGLFIQVGFALLTCGLVRKKNAAHLVMLAFSAYVFASLAYYAVGYGLQSGLRGFFFRGISTDARLLLNVAFMLVAAYVLVGAVCERITFRAFVLCELFLAGVLYPVFAEWAGTGWLSRIGAPFGLAHGFVDVSGASVVHELGGFCAMALALLLGPRLGKYGRDGQPRPFLAHNIVFVTTGTAIVAFGWMGLMVGWLGGTNALAARAIINTNIAATGGAAAAMLFWYYSYGKPDISMACNGLLAGLVSMSATAPFVGPNAALLIGAIGGLLASAGVLFNERTLKIDDPCGSVSIHGYCGLWGAVAVGVFADGTSDISGLLHGNWQQLVVQLIGALACAVLAFLSTYLVFAFVNRVSPMRVEPDIEAEGIDLTEFGMLAYPEEDGV